MSVTALKKARYFESQEEDEEVIFIIRKHWMVLAAPFFFCIILLGLVLALSWLMHNSSLNFLKIDLAPYLKMIQGAVILYAILFAFMSWLIRYLNVVILTNKHIVEIEQVSLFNRKISTLALDHVEDVTSEQVGIIRTLLDFGNVHIQTAGEMSNFIFQNFKDPEGIERRIMEAKSDHENSFRKPLEAQSSPQLPPQTPPINMA